MEAEEQAAAAGVPSRRGPGGAGTHAGSDPLEGHTSKTMDQSLTDLRTHAVEMGGLVLLQVREAANAYTTTAGPRRRRPRPPFSGARGR